MLTDQSLYNYRGRRKSGDVQRKLGGMVLNL